VNAEKLSQLGVEPQEIEGEPEAYRIRLTSNSQSLAILRELSKEYSIHPRIRALASEIIKDCPEKDYDCYISKVTDFVKRNVKYVNDPPRTEVFQSPLKTLELGIGDCDDFSVLTASLLRAVGLEAVPKILPVNKRWGHVIVEVFHPGRKAWIEIDATDKEENMEGLEAPVFELGNITPEDSLEAEVVDLESNEEVAELGRRFTGRRWLMVFRRGNLYRELWYFGRRHKLIRRYPFSGRFWIIRKRPLYRHLHSPIIYYRELWDFRRGKPVRLLRRYRWKIVRSRPIHIHRPHHHKSHHPHHRILSQRHVKHTNVHNNRSHFEAGVFNSKTIPVLLGIGAIVWALKKI